MSQLGGPLPEVEPVEEEGKLGTKTLDAIGNWFNNTAYGQRFKEGQERQAALEQTLIDQGGPASLYYKLKNQPNELEQNLLKGISDFTGIDERITTPATYLGLSAGMKGLSKLKPSHFGITTTTSPYVASSRAQISQVGFNRRGAIDVKAYTPKPPVASIPKRTSAAVVRQHTQRAGLAGPEGEPLFRPIQPLASIFAMTREPAKVGKVAVQAGDKGRTVASAVTTTKLGRSIKGSGYSKKSWMYDRVQSRMKVTGIREKVKGVVHHKGPLKRFGVGLAKHPSFTELTSGAKRSDVSIYMEKNLGIKLGNDPANLVDILETQTYEGRRQAIAGTLKALDNKIHKDTVNDLLGTSDLKFGAPPPEDRVQNLIYHAEGALGKYPKSEFRGNPFPEIEIKHPETGELITTWRPQNDNDFKFRFQKVAKILNDNGVDVDITKYNPKNIKISPTAEIYGKDHQTVHTLEKYFARTPGNPLYDFEAAVQDGSIAEMTVPQAGQLAGQAYFLMENINKQVLAYRYNKIKEVFADKNPELDAAYFDKLDIEVQRDFFEANINEIAVKGGMEKIITKEQALTEFKGWTPEMDKFWDFTDVVKPTKPKGRLGEVRRLDKPFEP